MTIVRGHDGAELIPHTKPTEGETMDDQEYQKGKRAVAAALLLIALICGSILAVAGTVKLLMVMF